MQTFLIRRRSLPKRREEKKGNEGRRRTPLSGHLSSEKPSRIGKKRGGVIPETGGV